MFVTHPLIREEAVEARDYQLNLSVAAARDSLLVVLPTGMGKTVVALLVLADAIKGNPGKKILLLAPTKPLVDQHVAFLAARLRTEALGGDPARAVVAFSGDVPPEERAGMWREARVVVATPQVVENDLISRRYDLSDVCLVIYDEAHRGVGDYSYVYVAESFRTQSPSGRSLGITASPGSTAEEILSLCATLGLARAEIRDEYDPDVVPYVHRIQMEWRRIELPEEQKKVIAALKAAFAARVKALRRLRMLPAAGEPSRKDLLVLAGEIQARLRDTPPDSASDLYEAMTLQAQAVKLSHALELAETQGPGPFLSYAAKLRKEAEGKGASKASRALAADRDFTQAQAVARHFQGVHPKVAAVVAEVTKELRARPASRVIVFTHFRDTSEVVLEHLAQVPGAKPARFIGQSSRAGSKGITQKAQKEMVEAFRNGSVNVLVGTSVAEEGLDIPETDLVVFYEPIPSEIRTIQRRGRTGRKRDGRAVVLMAAGTRDEAYHWASRRREENMRKEIRLLRDQLTLARERRKGQQPLPAEIVPAAGPPPRAPVHEPQPPPTGRATAGPAEDAIGDWMAARGGARRGQAVLLHEDVSSGAAPAPTTAPSLPAPAAGSVSGAATEPEATWTQGPAAGTVPLSETGAAASEPVPLVALRDPSALRERFRGEEVVILVDHREFRSSVVRHLSRLPLRVEGETLAIADYVLSSRVAVERKEVSDFLESLMSGRLFKQARGLAAFRSPILVVEGAGLTESRNIPRASIYGALASLTADYGITVLTTRDAAETADLLYAIAKREQTEARREAPIRPEKAAMSDEEQVRFILEGLPGVSAVLARRLVEHFGSAARAMRASEAQLQQVEGIGPKIAREVRRILDLDLRRQTAPPAAEAGADERSAK